MAAKESKMSLSKFELGESIYMTVDPGSRSLAAKMSQLLKKSSQVVGQVPFSRLHCGFKKRWLAESRCDH